MKVIKYDVQFVKDFGKNYSSNLSKDLLSKFTNLKNEFDKELSNNVPQKKVQDWRINENTSSENKVKKLDTIKEVYLHLNKLSDSNIDTIGFQINNLIENVDPLEKSKLVEKLVIRLFQNAKIQIQFCHLYAALFSKLIHKNKDLYFEQINSKIKLEFENIESMKASAEDGNYDNYCDSIQIKENYIGCYQFCIELYSYNVLTITNISQIINNIIHDLANQEEIYRIEIIVESICRIVNTLKKSTRIDNTNIAKLIDIIKIGYINNKKKLNPRSRFLYEDAINVKN